MDPVILAGMIFTLIVLLMIGGFILLFPLARQLGRVLELRLQDRQNPRSEAEVIRLRDSVERLQDELRSLGQRQDFVEGLLRTEAPAALPSPHEPAAE